jgi:hypothetical protein
MSPERIIPITPIMRRYQRLRTAAQRDRLSEARRVLEHPEELAAEFATSVRHFAAYRNVNEHFYDAAGAKRRAQHRPGKMLRRTNDLVLRLEKLEPGDGIHPVDSDSRIPAVVGDSLVDVPAADLAFEYADRELLTQRTTSPARWEDGTPNRGGVRLDVLLANLDDRTPIATEVKVARDMNPFFALVQALACAAHLPTPNQYERLRRHVFRGRFREPVDAPQSTASQSQRTGLVLHLLDDPALGAAALLIPAPHFQPGECSEVTWVSADDGLTTALNETGGWFASRRPDRRRFSRLDRPLVRDLA